MMEVVLSGLWVGANAYVFATDIDGYNGEFRGRAINRYSFVPGRRLLLSLTSVFSITIQRRVVSSPLLEVGLRCQTARCRDTNFE